jgi:hypothetical protein
MASKEELLEKNKDELLELAKERELEGRSGMNKDELAEALADDSSSEETEEDEALADKMEPEHEGGRGQLQEEDEDFASRLNEGRSADDVHKSQLELEEEAGEDLERFKQPEEERIMTGSVPDDDRTAASEDAPEDHVGNITEAGETAAASDRRERARGVEEEGVKQEEVIDFPPPVGEREGEEVEEDGTQIAQEKAHSGLLGNTNVLGSDNKTFGQKAQFYTDGLSGPSEMNLERAYELPELLQSNDPVVREAGDLSESSGVEHTEEELEDAEEVKSGERAEAGDDE